MTTKTDEEKLLESWTEHFEGLGFSEANARRAGEIAAGPAVMARVQEAQGQGGLREAYQSYFEGRGIQPETADRMAEVAAHADRGLILRGETSSRDEGDQPLQSGRRDGPDSADILLQEQEGNLGCIVIEGR